MDKEKQFLEYSHSLNHYIFSKIPKDKKVLDLGCNTGLLGKKLIEEKNCIVYGVDYSKEAIKIAKKNLIKAEIGDLEKEIPFKGEKFDRIILADIIEHLKYPEELLIKLKDFLKKDGEIIASIPNVANISIRLGLLFGNWNYKKTGILDKTHLRFFTKKTIKELFYNSGYKIIKLSSTPGFDFIVLRHFKILIYLRDKLCKIYPKLFALQFIVVAKNKF